MSSLLLNSVLDRLRTFKDEEEEDDDDDSSLLLSRGLFFDDAGGAEGTLNIEKYYASNESRTEEEMLGCYADFQFVAIIEASFTSFVLMTIQPVVFFRINWSKSVFHLQRHPGAGASCALWLNNRQITEKTKKQQLKQPTTTIELILYTTLE